MHKLVISALYWMAKGVILMEDKEKINSKEKFCYLKLRKGVEFQLFLILKDKVLSLL